MRNFLKNKILHYQDKNKFEFKIKKKLKRLKMPKPKIIKIKSARQIAGLFFTALLLFSFISIWRSVYLQNKTHGIVKTVNELKIAVEDNQDKNNDKIINYASLSDYTQNVMANYINVNVTAGEKDEKRDKSLAGYLAFSISDLKENFTSPFHRVLKKNELVDVEIQDDLLLARCRVTYDIETVKNDVVLNKNADGTKTPQKSDVLERKSKTQDIILPIKEKNGQYLVVSAPYFQSVSIPKYTMDQEQVSIEKRADLTSSEEVKLLQFLNIFFEKYGKGEKNELKLLMKKVELTAGNFETQKIISQDCQFFAVKANPKLTGILVSVLFTDVDTAEQHREQFTLFVKPTDNSFEIQKMKHYYTLSEK